MNLTKEQIKELREDARKIIEYQQPIAVKVYDRCQRGGGSFGYSVLAGTDWFLLEVMSELSGLSPTIEWLREGDK